MVFPTVNLARLAGRNRAGGYEVPLTSRLPQSSARRIAASSRVGAQHFEQDRGPRQDDPFAAVRPSRVVNGVKNLMKECLAGLSVSPDPPNVVV